MESRLAAFRAKYGVTFTRETFTRNRPNARGEFELTPNDNGNRAGRDPLPPLGCHIKVYDYNGGEAWQTVVTAVDKQRGTYVATIIQDGGAR